MEGIPIIIGEKLRGIGRQEKWKEMGTTDNITNTIQEKLKQLLLALENFWGYLTGWFDEQFPPETREEQLRHWIHMAKPYLIMAAVVLVISICCCGCLGRFFGCLGRCLRRLCCCCRGRSSVNMMKAPGRSYMRIQRPAFESNPRGYFRGLRGKPTDYVLV